MLNLVKTIELPIEWETIKKRTERKKATEKRKRNEKHVHAKFR